MFEISLFIQGNQAYLFDLKLISSEVAVPQSVVPEILVFIGTQVALHMGFCLLIWFTAINCIYLFNIPDRFQAGLAVSLWFAAIISILAFNQALFPNSRYADLTSMLLPTAAALTLAVILGVAVLIALCCALFAFLLYSAEKSMNVSLLVMLLLASGAYVWQTNYNQPATIPNMNSNKPNIVIIGIDSLRPDTLTYFGGNTHTPFLDKILSQSSVFTNSITPLARTFPSWVSILTGKYPKDSGARSNLTDISKSEIESTLPSILQKNGYQTVYATDETRFSNIDKSFGFDVTINPPIGLNDFVLGTFNDFPLSNLLVNSELGSLLFPYSHANRPAVVTYQPDTFLSDLRSFLLKPRQKPLFMAVHFCLPHFPYAWAGLPAKDYGIRERYYKSIIRADEQVAGFFQIMDRAGLLKNTLVILLSDHGEALELPGDRITEAGKFIGHGSVPQFYPRGLHDEKINQSAGHGTDILGLSQYHTLLALKFFGSNIPEHKQIKSRVSLIDIKPTVLDFAGIDPQAGQSLLAALMSPLLPERHIFLESDYSPESIRSIYPDIQKTMLQGAHMFRVDPKTTRLHLKPEMKSKIMQSKQYADMYKNWILALYPQHQGGYQPILVNLKTGHWTNDMNSDFAMRSPAKSMYLQVKSYAKQR